MADKMQYAGDICFISGKFTNDAGEEKNRYVKCGAYFQSGDRTGIKLEFIPVGIDPVKGLWMSLFPKKDSKPKTTSNQNNSGNSKPPEDEVPF